MTLLAKPSLLLLSLLLACRSQKPVNEADSVVFSSPPPARLPPSLFAAPLPLPVPLPEPLPLPPIVSAPPPPAWPKGDPSEPILGGFWNPMPGGVLAGYRADTGLDIMGVKQPVYAMASGYIDYAEWGHTLWTGPRDTAYCVRVELDKPVVYKDKKITHIYYAHLSALELTQEEGKTPRVHIDAGDKIGVSGVANGSYHLHIGFLLDGEVRQYWGTFLYEDEIREVMGGYRKGARLPK